MRTKVRCEKKKIVLNNGQTYCVDPLRENDPVYIKVNSDSARQMLDVLERNPNLEMVMTIQDGQFYTHSKDSENVIFVEPKDGFVEFVPVK